MKAARWHGRGDIRIEEVPLPELSPSQALIRVLWCGICGSDLEEYRDGPLTVPVGSPHPVSGRMAPLTLGHEVVGIIAERAADGSGPEMGTVVIPDVVVPCGGCWWCLRHEYGLCANLSVLGQYDDGGLAEFMAARAATCVVVPDTLETGVAALAEPTAVAIRAIRKIPSPIGSRVAVMGGGAIGQLVSRVALAAGAAWVVVVDPLAERRALALAAGARAVAPDEFEEFVAGLTEPGLDVIVECTGRPGLLSQSIRHVRRGGMIVAVGLRSGDEEIPLADVVLGEKLLVGSAAHVWDTDVSDAVRMLADGRIDANGLISHRIPLSDLVTEGLPMLADLSTGAMKVLVNCSSA